MQFVIRLTQRPIEAHSNGFAADLAALSSLCFAGYLGLLVF